MLAWCSPKAAVISCGVNNTYGHPHPQLLDRFREKGIPWYVTAESGAIQMTTDGRFWKVTEWLREFPESFSTE
jgi:competence protein ComEC